MPFSSRKAGRTLTGRGRVQHVRADEPAGENQVACREYGLRSLEVGMSSVYAQDLAIQ
jgi:hypothetical protein